MIEPDSKLPTVESIHTAPPALPAGSTTIPEEQLRRQRAIVITLVIIGIVLLAGFVTSIYFLMQPSTDTAKVRDIMIIFMALELMILGVAMVILMVQLATLINLLQNDIKPILEATNETANTLRGTAMFLSENLTEPVIKINEYASGLVRLGALIGLVRRR